VAEGRGLSLETVQQIARGRIWSGEDALELGLIDELGGFPAAYRLAREAAGLEPDAAIRIKLFPRPVSPLQALTGEGPENSRPGAEAAAIAEVFEMIRPAVRLAHEVGLGPEPGVLTMPAIRRAE
jgi:protease-4